MLFINFKGFIINFVNDWSGDSDLVYLSTTHLSIFNLPYCRWYVGLFASTVSLPRNRLFYIWHNHQQTVELLMKYSQLCYYYTTETWEVPVQFLVECLTLQVAYWIHGFLELLHGFFWLAIALSIQQGHQ